MRRRRSSPRKLAGWALIGLLVALWFVWLRPTALGGAASYVIVKGSSMEPTYDDGDLVIVREEAHYDDGEVIAFRAGGRFDDPTRVIHRIVGSTDDGGAFVTQGDNRDRTDPWEPTPDDVIGRSVLHVPHLGDLAAAAGRPAVLAALGGAAVMVGGQRRRRRRMTQVPEGTPPPAGWGAPPPTPSAPRTDGAPPRWLRHTEPRWAFIGLVASAVLLVPVLALAWSAIRAPDSAVRMDRTGTLDLELDVDYRFAGEPSPVYPSGVVATTADASGARVPTDPLYTRLLDRLELALAFRAAGEGTDDLAGSYTIDISVEVPEGWSTTLGTIDPTTFDGTATELVTVHLEDAATRVAQVGALTGVGGDEYTVVVSPRLEVQGASAGEPVSARLAPVARFVVSKGVIDAQPIAPAREHRELARETRERVDYGLGPLSLGTQTARGLLGGLALVLLAGLAVSAGVLFGGIGLAESQRIAARYRSQIVDVSHATGPPGPVVMVSAMDELARLAKVEQSVILHEDLGDGCHRYRVFLGAVTYEYESAPEHGGRAAEPVSGSDAGPQGT